MSWGNLVMLALAMTLWGTAAVGGEVPAQPLSLGEACRLADKENAAVKVSRLQELMAEQEVARARSGFLPKVNAVTSHTFYDKPYKLDIIGSYAVPLTNRNFWGSQIMADQTIFDLATPARYGKAKAGREAARLDTQATRDDIFLTTAKLFFHTLRAEKLVSVAEQEVVQLTNHLKIATDLYDYGVVTQNDVLQAKVALADARQRLISAKNQVVTQRSTLNKLVGIPVPYATRLVEEKGISVPGSGQEEATTEALEARSDLKAAGARVKQGEKGVLEAKSGYLPRFYAQAGHTWQQNDRYVNGSQYFAILGLQWNLFNGLDTRAQVAQAQEKVQQLKVQEKDLNDQVQLEVQTAYLGLKETAERIAATHEAVTQGEENLRLNEERYKEQVGTATDVIDAQTLLTQTRVNYTNALYEHQYAKAEMLRAMGRIRELSTAGGAGNGQGSSR